MSDRQASSDKGKRTTADFYKKSAEIETHDGLGSFNGPKTSAQSLSDKGRRSKGDETYK